MTMTRTPTEPLDVRGVELAVGRGPVRKQLVSGVSFTSDRGTMTTLVGRSGCGKSTLLRCLAGAVRPSSGSVRVAGTDLWPHPRRRDRGDREGAVGIVLQSDNLVPSLSVLNNVALPDRLRGRRDWRARAEAALDRVGLEGRGRGRPDDLSGGEHQRVAIARLIASRPAVALVDEPTSSLDEVTAESVAGALQELANTGTAVLVVTHDLRLATRGDQTFTIEGGLLHDRSGQDSASLRSALEDVRC